MTEAPTRHFQQLLSEGKRLWKWWGKRNDQRGNWIVKGPERSYAEGSPEGSSCGLNNGKPDWKGAFSPGKNCKCLLVRGTASFCKRNCNSTWLEKVKWNVSMRFDEWCWRGTISFSAAFHLLWECLISWTYVLIECSLVFSWSFHVSNNGIHTAIGYLVVKYLWLFMCLKGVSANCNPSYCMCKKLNYSLKIDGSLPSVRLDN